MSDTIFCYHCRLPHPKSEMRLLVTKTGKRWRCLKSIRATKRSVAERDAFGKRMTEMNSDKQRIVVKAAQENRAAAGG
jgi:hypothetical protein